MRFIINFFLFGFLFYLISVFFPDAFSTLVSWAAHVYTFFHDLVMGIVERIQDKKTAEVETIPSSISAMIPWADLRRLAGF